MKLSDAISKITKTAWSYTNTFNIQITVPDEFANLIGGQFTEDINISLVQLVTPSVNVDSIEKFIGQQWRIQNGKFPVYRFTATFKDYNNMALYSKFFKFLTEQSNNYFDTCAATIILTKESDWKGNNDKVFMVFEGCLIDAISSVDFNTNSEAQIAEFNVQFKANKMTVF